MSKVIGIDVSKQDFDVFYKKGGQSNSLKFNNELKGFKKLCKHLDPGDVLVMEASGAYYLKLATYLFEQGFSVSVVNPLKIRRYCQALFARAKTDKKDAELICKYGEQFKPALWKPDCSEIAELRQLYSSCELLEKQIVQLGLHLSAMITTGTIAKVQRQTLEEQIAFSQQQKEKLELRIKQIAKENYIDQIKLLCSIGGIGPKTAIYLIVVSNNFKNFEHYKQFTAYVGLSPRVYQSGTSVRGKGRICKLGNSYVRKLLFMCSKSAARCNPKCIEMEVRLKEKGKAYKVRRIAVANKLIKQVFAVVNTQTPFDKNYVPKVCF